MFIGFPFFTPVLEAATGVEIITPWIAVPFYSIKIWKIKIGKVFRYRYIPHPLGGYEVYIQHGIKLPFFTIPTSRWRPLIKLPLYHGICMH